MVVAVLLWTAVAAVLGSVAAQRSEPPSPWTVVALGDSYVEGAGVTSRSDAFVAVYASSLAADLGIETELVNLGGGGHRPVGVWAQLVELSPRHANAVARADVVVLWLGWHDIFPVMLDDAPWSASKREQLMAINEGLPAAWEAFLATVRATAPAHATILLADSAVPPYVLDRFRDRPEWPEIKRLAFLDWREAMMVAAERHGVVVVPTYVELNGPDGEDEVGPGDCSADRVHCDAVVHRRIAEVYREHDGFGTVE